MNYPAAKALYFNNLPRVAAAPASLYFHFNLSWQVRDWNPRQTKALLLQLCSLAALAVCDRGMHAVPLFFFFFLGWEGFMNLIYCCSLTHSLLPSAKSQISFHYLHAVNVAWTHRAGAVFRADGLSAYVEKRKSQKHTSPCLVWLSSYLADVFIRSVSFLLLCTSSSNSSLGGLLLFRPGCGSPPVPTSEQRATVQLACQKTAAAQSERCGRRKTSASSTCSSLETIITTE